MLPLFDRVEQLALAGHVPGGGRNNRSYFEPRTGIAPDVPEGLRLAAFDPQTSGGLLLAVPRSEEAGLLQALRTAGWSAAERVGTVAPRGTQCSSSHPGSTRTCDTRTSRATGTTLSSSGTRNSRSLAFVLSTSVIAIANTPSLKATTRAKSTPDSSRVSATVRVVAGSWLDSVIDPSVRRGRRPSLPLQARFPPAQALASTLLAGSDGAA